MKMVPSCFSIYKILRNEDMIVCVERTPRKFMLQIHVA